MTKLIHIPGLLADDKNFKEQEKFDFGMPQYAVNYWQYVNRKGPELIEEIRKGLVHELTTLFPDEKFVLHGNSAGGFLAMLLAQSPELYKKIAAVIFNCSAGLGETLTPGNGATLFKYIQGAKSKEEIPALIDYFVQLPKQDVPKRLVDEIYDLCENRAQIGKFIRWGQIFKDNSPLVKDLFLEGVGAVQSQQIPTLVIGGVNDTVTEPKTIREMAGLLGVEPMFFNTGHAPHIQLPDDFNTTVLEFLRTHSTGSGFVEVSVPLTAQ